MSRPNKAKRRFKQLTSDELLNELLGFLQRKFYEGRAVAFQKDRRRLLEWVVLWPARWLDERGVTVASDKYREIFMSVFMDSLRFGDTANITYLPAWLAKVIQSHFDHHGEEIYEEAKSVRALTENALLMARGAIVAGPDPVRDLAQAARLLRRSKKHPVKPSNTGQLNLI